MFLREMIAKRKQEMALPSFKNKGDFLTLLLSDDLFKDKDDYMVDECLTFMLAATMTTTMLISNAIYYLTQNPESLSKLRKEMAKNIKSAKPMTNLNNEEWKQILLDDELLTDCSYLGYCVNETLRVDPSLRFSTVHEIVGDCKIGQYNVLNGQEFIINIYGL